MDAFLSDVIATIHLAVVAFMVLGILLVLIGWPLGWRWIRNPWFRLGHLAITGCIALNAVRGELCFLTLWERSLRARAGPKDRSFVGGLLHDILFVDVPQKELDRYYLAFGALVLLSIVCVRPRFRRREREAAGVS